MKVKDAMTSNVVLARPDHTLRDAARLMARCDTGVLPVSENDRLVGMITDRDIVVRAVAEGKPIDTPVREVMSSEVLYCFEDECLEHVAQNMGEQQVRRLPVLDREKRLVGIVSLGDLATISRAKTSGETIAAISIGLVLDLIEVTPAFPCDAGVVARGSTVGSLRQAVAQGRSAELCGHRRRGDCVRSSSRRGSCRSIG